MLDTLLARADVFVHNLAPGAVERLGLDSESMRDRHPALITCRITGYGPIGPYRDRKAYDLLVQCEAGLLSITGTSKEPAKVGVSIADIAAGMYAYTGVLAALYERERTGAGSAIEVAMLDALAEWMSQPYLQSYYSGRVPERTGARHSTIAPYGPFRCAGGDEVFLAVQNDREWAVMCTELLGRPELSDDPRFRGNPERLAHVEELTPLIEVALANYSCEEAIGRMDRLGIASAQLRGIADLADHPQLAARDRWRTVDSPGGPVRMLLPPVSAAGHAVAMGAVPALGADSDSVRAEFAPAAPRCSE